MVMQKQDQDWAYLQKYREENNTLKKLELERPELSLSAIR